MQIADPAKKLAATMGGCRTQKKWGRVNEILQWDRCCRHRPRRAGRRPAPGQNLPVAKPESVGLSSVRLENLRASLQTEVDEGHIPRCRAHDQSPRQIGLFGGYWLPEQGCRRADEEGRDIPHLFDDQTHCRRGGDDTGGGRQVGARRSGRQVFAGIRGHARLQCRHGRRWQDGLHPGSRREADYGSGSAAPYVGNRLRRDDEELGDQAGIYGCGSVRRGWYRLRPAPRPAQGRGDGSGQGTPFLTARHQLGVRHVDGLDGPGHRSGVRPETGAVHRRENSKTLADDRHRLLCACGEAGAAGRTS